MLYWVNVVRLNPKEHGQVWVMDTNTGIYPINQRQSVTFMYWAIDQYPRKYGGV